MLSVILLLWTAEGKITLDTTFKLFTFCIQFYLFLFCFCVLKQSKGEKERENKRRSGRTEYCIVNPCVRGDWISYLHYTCFTQIQSSHLFQLWLWRGGQKYRISTDHSQPSKSTPFTQYEYQRSRVCSIFHNHDPMKSFVNFIEINYNTGAII